MKEPISGPFRIFHTKVAYGKETLYFSTQPKDDFLHIYSYAESEFQKKKQFHLYSHGWVFQYIAEGRGTLISADEIYPLEPGCLFLQHPDEEYQIKISNKSDLKKLHLGLDNNIVATSILTICELKEKVIFPESEAISFRKFFSQGKELIVENSTDVHQKLSLFAYQFFKEFRSKKTFPDSDSKYIQAINILRSNLRKKYTLDSLGQLFGTSSRSLYRLFQKNFHCSPHEYLIRLRMENAKQLLSVPSLSIYDIAGECGYSTPSQFACDFRSRFGMTPHQYRMGLLPKK